MNANRIARGALLALLLFLAITALVSAPILLLDRMGLPPELLAGSPFSDYTVPALALLAVAALATVATLGLWRRHRLALHASLLAALAILIFEGVELSVVGWSWLQGVYLAVGALILALAAFLWLKEPESHPRSLVSLR